ncbi:HdeD family acid-resistance protein [Microbispora corallina]|uniref:Membrane protein n=1 Tax=Microbispora corallina TaxID=83302 RepID=A0ABQ4FWF7_9ACTN|nr:HdeD family acid-resistance protein [Microbispora corallina]GIH39107.1 membrane protein [Microbispora corallina]
MHDTAMRHTVAAHWWVPAVRGVLTILFGVIAIAWPKITLLALVTIFGAYALVNGVFTLFQAARGHTGQSRGWLIFEGLVGLLAGIAAFAWPGITTLALLLVIASWFVVIGVFEIIEAIALRRQIEGEWLLALNGLVAVVFGLLLFIWPATGALAIVWLIGVSAIVFGISLIAHAFGLRGHRPRVAAGPSPVV